MWKIMMGLALCLISQVVMAGLRDLRIDLQSLNCTAVLELTRAPACGKTNYAEWMPEATRKSFLCAHMPLEEPGWMEESFSFKSNIDTEVNFCVKGRCEVKDGKRLDNWVYVDNIEVTGATLINGSLDNASANGKLPDGWRGTDGVGYLTDGKGKTVGNYVMVSHENFIHQKIAVSAGKEVKVRMWTKNPLETELMSYESPIIPVSQLSAVKLPDGTMVTNEPRHAIELPKKWRLSEIKASGTAFAEDQTGDARIAAVELNDSNWKSVMVPLNWYLVNPELRNTAMPYHCGWYRVRFNIARPDKAMRYLMDFENVGYEMKLWVNGMEIGSHHGDFTTARFDITPGLKAGDNVLTVKVLADLGPKFGTGKAKHAYGSQWGINSIKGGIWGNVSLNAVPEIYVNRTFVTPRFKEKQLALEVEIINASERTLQAELANIARSAMKDATAVPISMDTHEVTIKPGRNIFNVTMNLQNPVNWSLETPFLYYLQTVLARDGRVLDVGTERFGFREFKTEGCYFYLNGKRIYLFGENIVSEVYGGRGQNDTPRLVETLKGFKDKGYVILRTPHQPIIPEALKLADEIGIMLIDEWAWAFSDPLDETVWEKNNLAEIEEWVRRDYNHPAVVMWSGGNEVFCTDNPQFRVSQMNKQYDLVKRLDKSNRPMSVMDGAAGDYGAPGLKSDVLVNHNYVGYGGFKPWTMIESSFAKEKEKMVNVFQKVDKPVYIGECVGFSWGDPSRYYVRGPLEQKKYLELAQLETNWGVPSAPAGASVCGIEAWIDPEFGMKWGQNMFGKRVLETFRRLSPEIQGWAPWIQSYQVPNIRIWNAPLQTVSADLNLNPISGTPFFGKMVVMNDRDEMADAVKLVLSLVKLPPNNKPFYPPEYLESIPAAVVATQTIEVGKIGPFQHKDLAINFTVPESVRTGDYRLNLQTTGVVAGKLQTAVNFYPVYVFNRQEAETKIVTAQNVGLIDFANTDTRLMGEILNDLGIKYELVANSNDLNAMNVMIVPPSLDGSDASGKVKISEDDILNWINRGGRLLIMEQLRLGGLPFFGKMNLTAKNPNALVDLVLPRHPVFKDMKQRNFDGWDGGDHQLISRYSINVLSDLTVAASGPRLGFKGITTVLIEGKTGKGTVMASQLEAVSRWKKDAAATKYLRNLLVYQLVEKPNSPLPIWQSEKQFFIVGNRQPFFVDIAPFANRRLTDDRATGGQEGWTNQGENDLRDLPTGRQIFCNLPYNIIGGKNTNGALILGGEGQPQFPREINGIKIGRRADALCFLHGCAWGHQGVIAKYIVNFQDGTRQEIFLRDGVEIADWWKAGDLPKAKVAWSCEKTATSGKGIWTAAGWIGLYSYIWNNPYPEKEIKTVDFISTGIAVPFLLAITGIAPNDDRIEVEAGGKRNTWNCFMHPKNGENQQVPTATPADTAFFGKQATLLQFVPSSSTQTACVFTNFKSELAKLDKTKHQILNFWIRNTGPNAAVTIGLPKRDWSRSLEWEVLLSGQEWQLVTLDLKKAAAEQNVDIKALRGEFFIYNCLQKGNCNPAVKFYIADIVIK